MGGGTGMGSHRARVLILLCALVLLAGCGASSSAPARTLAHDGGTRITLQASCPAAQPGCDLSAGTTTAATVLQQRAATLGVANPVARASGNGQITLELPAATLTNTLKSALVTAGRVAVINTGETFLSTGSSVAGKTCAASCQDGQYHVLFTGSQLDPDSVSASSDRQTGQPVVTFAFNDGARQAFADYTRQHIGQYLTITLDDTVIESATIQSEIDNTGQVTGLASMDQARNLAAYMKYGPLPVALTIVSEQRVAPSA